MEEGWVEHVDQDSGCPYYVTEALGESRWAGRLALNYTTAGTRHGLSKFIYWRDT